MANFNLNRAVLGGRLTADPDVRFTNSDRAVCSFTVAVNRPYKDADGNTQSDFIRCVAWGSTAEFVDKYFRKGSSICVIGEITTRSYENDDEETVYVTEVTVRDVQFVDSKSESEGAEKKSEKSEKSEKKPKKKCRDDEDSEEADDFVRLAKSEYSKGKGGRSR